MTETKSEKKKTSPLVFVGIGCLVLLVLIGLGTTIVMKFFAKSIGTGMLEKAIESKTGTTIDLGGGSMPENFPKDFPVYPGVKVTSSLSGGESDKGTGFWLTLSTPDALDRVTTFYKTSLVSSGWTETANYTANGTTTKTVKKGTMSGSVSIMREESAEETQIVIVLGEESN